MKETTSLSNSSREFKMCLSIIFISDKSKFKSLEVSFFPTTPSKYFKTPLIFCTFSDELCSNLWLTVINECCVEWDAIHHLLKKNIAKVDKSS